MKIPEPINTTAAAIYALHERNNVEQPREYLGMSQIGELCERQLWLSFRWAVREQFEGRMLRLFETGHREEARVIAELRAIGCNVRHIDPNTRKQIGVISHGGHFRGHVDAIVQGLPEAPKTWHLVDVKTTNSKKFAELTKQGMEKLYPKYWAQAHAYMGKLELDRAMYIFVCKDTDEIYPVRFEFDKAVFEANEAKAERVIFSDRIPAPISTDSTWHECRYCAAHDFCHGSKMTQQVNCRTCLHSTAERDGRWTCAHWGMDIPDVDAQRNGCDSHLLHPDLVPPDWKYEPKTDDGVIWLTPHGKISQPEYLSTEIVANPAACASGLRDAYAQWGARVVG